MRRRRIDHERVRAALRRLTELARAHPRLLSENAQARLRLEVKRREATKYEEKN